MSKALYIAEKPSVAQEFAKALKESMARRNGYLESDHSVVTWCVGHLVTMSYPDKYDEKYKKWSFETLPFLPEHFKYEVIPEVKKTVSDRQRPAEPGGCGHHLRLHRLRAGGGIHLSAGSPDGPGSRGKSRRRVWIDSRRRRRSSGESGKPKI